MDELEKVYIIRSYDYDNPCILGVFKNKDLASDLSKYLEWVKNDSSIHVEEQILDSFTQDGEEVLTELAKRIYIQKTIKED